MPACWCINNQQASKQPTKETTTMTKAETALDNISPASALLLFDLINDAPNWNGQPLIDITKEQRGNLTDLKRRGLLKTFTEEGCQFAIFTEIGIEVAAKVNVKIDETF
jgi:hypothetical protein